jgi:hypothetical protein
MGGEREWGYLIVSRFFLSCTLNAVELHGIRNIFTDINLWVEVFEETKLPLYVLQSFEENISSNAK